MQEFGNSTLTNYVLTPNNDVNEDSTPKLIRTLIEQGIISADAQIKELLTDIQYPENLYALKYILEHEGEYSAEVLTMAMESLYPKQNGRVF